MTLLAITILECNNHVAKRQPTSAITEVLKTNTLKLTNLTNSESMKVAMFSPKTDQ